MIVEQMLKNAPNPLLHIADVSGSALFNGDCLDIMPLIPDKSVQLILADLPYGTTACKWDSIIDLDLLWKQYKRIIKDNGAIILTASQPFTTKLISSNYEMFRYCWVWDKISVTGNMLAKKQPLRAYEDVCVFYKSQTIYNPILRDKPKKDIRITNVKVKNNSQTHPQCEYNQFDRREHPKDKSYPTNVIRINNYGKNHRRLHPTEKHIDFMKYLIFTYSNEKDMVLDNTMGSGTTCLAAKELNRRFIGIEKEANYYEIACRRCGF
jgi:site-specific DNA-methyltransferase (adenine-specific)